MCLPSRCVEMDCVTSVLLLLGADHTETTCHVPHCEFIGLLSALGVARTTQKRQSHILLRFGPCLELLPGNALVKSVRIFTLCFCRTIQRRILTFLFCIFSNIRLVRRFSFFSIFWKSFKVIIF
jgi:hypothetical protein